jgi:hypothetical protein
MNKYYVCAGELNVLVLADSPMKAALAAVTYASKHKLECDLGERFYIDQRGFRNDKTASVIIKSSKVMENYCGND